MISFLFDIPVERTTGFLYLDISSNKGKKLISPEAILKKLTYLLKNFTLSE